MNESQYPQLNNEAWLCQRYVVDGLTIAALAAEVGCERGAVARALKRFGIPTRRENPRIPELHDSEWLRKAIVTKPIRQIADELGCTYSAVRQALAKFRIVVPKRTTYRYVDKSAAVKAGLARRYPNGRTGKNASNWRGGIRIDPYGYVWLHRDVVAERWPEHPRLALPNWRSKQEHVLVMEAHLGRLLTAKERVDHGPGGKHDNRIENLTKRDSNGEHIASHWEDSRSARRLVREKEILLRTLDSHGIEIPSLNVGDEPESVAMWHSTPFPIRSRRDVEAAESEFFDRLWLNHHCLEIPETDDVAEYESLRERGEPVAHRVKGSSEDEAERLRQVYELAQGLLDQYGIEAVATTPFDLGMISGKLSTLRWVLGDDWDSLDT